MIEYYIVNKYPEIEVEKVIVDGSYTAVDKTPPHITFTEIDGTYDYHNDIYKNKVHKGYINFEDAKKEAINILEEKYKEDVKKLEIASAYDEVEIVAKERIYRTYRHKLTGICKRCKNKEDVFDFVKSIREGILSYGGE